jgi:NAD(P)-dependent dehydrogenase (short-subunit alcohol dehydrogenase family)
MSDDLKETGGFRGKVALVVGGASGMGQAVVRLLADRGCSTHVLDIKATENSFFQWCDVRDYSQVRRCVQKVVNEHGRTAGHTRGDWQGGLVPVV